MDNEPSLTDAGNADLDEVRQLRVKVSVRTLVQLQYFRLTQSKGISEVVNDALNAYFAGLDIPEPRPDLAAATGGAPAHGAPRGPPIGLGDPDEFAGATPS